MNQIFTHKHYLYLLLSIIGGGFTFYCAIKGMQQHNGNFDSIEFIASTWTDSFYAKSITLDFWTGAIAGTFFVLLEGLRLKMKRIWLYLLLTVLVAFAFSFPLFLYMRERQLKRNHRNI
jgi:hypothetical protein